VCVRATRAHDVPFSTAARREFPLEQRERSRRRSTFRFTLRSEGCQNGSHDSDSRDERAQKAALVYLQLKQYKQKSSSRALEDLCRGGGSGWIFTHFAYAEAVLVLPVPGHASSGKESQIKTSLKMHKARKRASQGRRRRRRKPTPINMMMRQFICRIKYS
jgi:hypothetical protein